MSSVIVAVFRLTRVFSLTEVWSDESNTTLVETMIFAISLFSGVEVQREKKLPSGCVQVNRERHSVGRRVLTAVNSGKKRDQKLHWFILKKQAIPLWIIFTYSANPPQLIIWYKQRNIIAYHWKQENTLLTPIQHNKKNFFLSHSCDLENEIRSPNQRKCEKLGRRYHHYKVSKILLTQHLRNCQQ